MVKGSSGNIQSYFKRQRTEAVAQDPPPAQPLPLLLELEQQHENQDEEPQTNYSVPLPVVFRGTDTMENKPDGLSDEPTKLSFQLLKEITNNFDPERILGSGASGQVFKGVFKDGKVVAVKRLSFIPHSDNKLFQNEFDHLKRLNHHNIVQLVGFCDEEEDVCVLHEGKMVCAVDIHRALCLEFVPNGGLGKFLSDKYLELNWHTRFRIIQGICQGLNYLHEHFTMHFDLKPENILLDEKMIPKIADFGLSRLSGEKNTIVTRTPLGTIGYLPPEFINKQVISKEYDIFSLGVIIKKIVTGMSGMDYWNVSHMDDPECIEHVHNNWRKRLQEIQAYASLEIDCKQVKTCIEIAVDCMKEDPRKRPTMKEITCRLSNEENKGTDSAFLGGQFFLPVPERPSTGNVMQSELEGGLVKKEVKGEDSPMKNKSFLRVSELPLEFLREITDNFSIERVVSKKACTTVFKGILRSGEQIAVKRFGTSYRAAGDVVFRNEIGKLMKIKHENILRLIGFCCEKKRKVIKHDGRYILTDEVESYLCYEYAQSGSLDKYIYDESFLDWNTRFKIIMGVCDGLHLLHTKLAVPILHARLAPEDILLDSNMVSKLSDVGVSNIFHMLSASSLEYDSNWIHGSSTERWKKGENMAPEYVLHGEISRQSDIYNLGILIMQIATREKNYPSHVNPYGNRFIEKVRRLNDIHMESKYPSLDKTCISQFKLCIQTGLRCTEFHKINRPSIWEIVITLKSGYLGSMLPKDITSSSTASQAQLISSVRHELSSYQSQPGSVLLLSVVPRRLCFPLKPKRLTSCLLYLTNNTKGNIAFRLLAKTPRRYHTKLPLCSIVPPKCTHTLTVTMREQKKQLLSNNEEFLTLQCCIAREEDIKNVDPASVVVFLEKAKEKTDHEVEEMMLPVVFESSEAATSRRSIQIAEVIESQNCRAVLSVDVHPTSRNHGQVLSVDVHSKEPWILTSNHTGTVGIWNYQNQEVVSPFEVSIDQPVYSAKFIERKDWLVAGDGDGYIHVYNYDTLEEVINFEAHENRITCLAVNPIFSFVLSASDDHLIKLWDWNKCWECMRTFEGHYNGVTQVTFHPKDSVNFASASLDRRVKIWNIFSGKCDITLDDSPDGLLCLHYFEDKQLRYVRQFLIVGSLDGAAKVWDPEKHSCIGTLKEHTNSLNALCWLTEQELFVTGSLDGTVQIWKPTGTTYRPENTVHLNLGAVNALGYIKESRRVVVGCEQGLAVVGIN